MADDKKKKDAGKAPGNGPAKKKKSHPFLVGLVVGLVIGAVLGFWLSPKPPPPVEGYRDAANERLREAADSGRERAADLAEDAASRLRGD